MAIGTVFFLNFFLVLWIFTWLLQYFPKNRAILVQKLWGEKSCQNSFLAILRLKKKLTKKKVPMDIKLKGGGKALVARPLVDELFFCSFPYIYYML